MNYQFDIAKKSTKSRARRGKLTTPHGVIQTPSFVTVATKGTVKTMLPADLQAIGTQFMFVNTYHLVMSPGVEILQKSGGIHNFAKLDYPLISDSGGFQVFSLGRDKKLGPHEIERPKLVKITDDGVLFRSHIDGTEYQFSPEFSIQAQIAIGADLIVAFDECAPLHADEKYVQKSLLRTHDWAKRSLATLQKSGSAQQMYGVIQGGMWEKYRKESTDFITSLPFFGIAFGGVSVGESSEELLQQVDWMTEALGEDVRPRHLLGVSTWKEALESIKMGVDTMDCILPTRDARSGRLYLGLSGSEFGSEDVLEIAKQEYKSDFSPIDSDCECTTCSTYSRAYLHHLFKQKEITYHRLASLHNLFATERWFERIRAGINNGSL